MSLPGHQRRERRRPDAVHSLGDGAEPSSWHQLTKGMQMAWHCVGQEMLEFPNHRARECMKATREIMHCQSTTELVDAQYRYTQELVHDYLDQAGWLAETWAQACAKSWIDLQRALLEQQAGTGPPGPA